MAVDDAEEFGVLAVAVFALVLLPVVVFAAVVGALGYVTYLCGRELVRWIARRLEPTPEELIEQDYQAARAAMNAAADADWRNLAG